MKKLVLHIVMFFVMGCIGVNAQRPLGDTTYVGFTPDYLFDTTHINGHLLNSSTLINRQPGFFIGFLYNYIQAQYLRDVVDTSVQGGISCEQYPYLATCQGGRYIIGQECPVTEEIKVIGLAVCPERLNGIDLYPNFAFFDVPNQHSGFSIVDSTISGSETEYVQLYTLRNGSTPLLQRQGAWRFDDPYRYMCYNHMIIPGQYAYPLLHIYFDTACIPLYEVMFDTCIYVSNETIVLAATHNNNDVLLTDTCYDTVYSSPHICFAHRPTRYTTSVQLPVADYSLTYATWWFKYESYPWRSYENMAGMYGRELLNLFPILDTLFGTPCATVSNLQAAAVDTLWATMMWSADARHHRWEVEYWSTGDPSDIAMEEVDSITSVTFTGLTPGTEYGVRVRGLCDKDNYSPWSDTLLFTTLRSTTPDTDTVAPPPEPLDIRAMGNLDRFTQMMPNPAGDWVSVLSAYRLVSVAVYDLAGRQMLEQPAEGISATLEVSALPQGTYIVAIRTLQGVATKKLVVKR